MKTIKIIDLLNKIANGEEVPEYIRYRDISKHKYDFILVCKENIIYKIDQCILDLNDEVEIIEEDKKIEKLDDILRVNDLRPPYDCNLEKIWIQTIKNHNKINELIDKANRLKEETK